MAARILVCDDERTLREMLSVLFRRAGYELTLASSTAEGLETIGREPPFDVVVTDLVMPDGTGMQVLEAARARDATTQVVMITAYATTAQAVEAMRLGAYDYVQKPFNNDELRATVAKALEKRQIVDENRRLRETLEGSRHKGRLVGGSKAMQRVLDMVERVASAPASVLVTGESGTGKEVVAREVHAMGSRKGGAFVAVNCGALPESLMESELFGYEKGAFTGAQRTQEGLVQAASGGTLFLDEIGELPANLQVKLLRVLQERKVRKVGGREEVEVDLRIVAATNRDVEEEVRAGRLRQDLFYRLNVIRIHIPPLRERVDDIPALAEHFVRKHAALHSKRLRLGADAMRWLMTQPWPGNVRELENAIERAVTLAQGETIGIGDLSRPELGNGAPATGQVDFSTGDFDLDAYLGTIERQLLERALEASGGVRTNAAKLLGVSFRSLRYRLAKYGLAEEDDPGSD